MYSILFLLTTISTVSISQPFIPLSQLRSVLASPRYVDNSDTTAVEAAAAPVDVAAAYEDYVKLCTTLGIQPVSTGNYYSQSGGYNYPATGYNNYAGASYYPSYTGYPSYSSTGYSGYTGYPSYTGYYTGGAGGYVYPNYGYTGGYVRT